MHCNGVDKKCPKAEFQDDGTSCGDQGCMEIFIDRIAFKGMGATIFYSFIADPE